MITDTRNHKPIVPGLESFEVQKDCRRCGKPFTTRSRFQKRCDSCREIVQGEQAMKNNGKRRVRRAAGGR